LTIISVLITAKIVTTAVVAIVVVELLTEGSLKGQLYGFAIHSKQGSQ